MTSERPVSGASADADQALVNQAPSGLGRPGFDPSREPEQHRLVERLVAKNTQHIHVDWGPEAHKLSAEERAAVLNAVMDEEDHPVLGLVAQLKGEAFMFEDSAHPQYDWKTKQHIPLTGRQKSAKQTADLLLRAADKLLEMYRDSDGNPEGGDGTAPSRSDDSAGRETASPTPSSVREGNSG